MSEEQANCAYAAAKAAAGNQPLTPSVLLRELQASQDTQAQQTQITQKDQARAIVRQIEDTYETPLADALGHAAMNIHGAISMDDLGAQMRAHYKDLPSADIDTMLTCVQVKANNTTGVNEVQAFLQEYTTSKQVGLILTNDNIALDAP